jgi:hypothetical protein
MLVGMTMMDDTTDDDGNGGSMADDVSAELDRHASAMDAIMSEHGMGPEGDEDEGSQPD